MFQVQSDFFHQRHSKRSMQKPLEQEKIKEIKHYLSFFDNQRDALEVTNITKLKVKSEKNTDDKFMIKITDDRIDHILFLNKQHQIQCFLSILKAKVADITGFEPLTEDFINHCQGSIFMKSFFGNLQKKYLFISKTGLTASQSKEVNFDLYIDRVKELWTRFELVNDKTFVVFKTRYQLLKYEFAIPVEHCIKWAKAFCSLLQQQ